MKTIQKKKQLAQNLMEFILIFALVAIACFGFVMKFNFGKFKNFVFLRQTDSADKTKIKIEAMTP